LKILVAEDEPEIMRIYTLLLKNKGYEVVGTDDGKKCIEAYKSRLKGASDGKTPFDLVMLDYRMPQKNGIEVAEEILHLCPAQKLLMVTAYKDQLELKDEKLKKVQLMEKPFDVDELLTRITRLASH
jgi:CheY-like chemotaxis protein